MNAKNEEKNNELIEAWQSYEKFGFKLVPVSIRIKNGKKSIDIPYWKKQSYSQIDFERNIIKRDGIAIKAGTQSNLFVVDVDKSDDRDGTDTLQKAGVSDYLKDNIPQEQGLDIVFYRWKQLENHHNCHFRLVFRILLMKSKVL